MRRLLWAAPLALVAWPAGAQAADRWSLTAAGDPLLTWEVDPYFGTPEWWTCRRRCLPFDAKGTRVEPGETPRGTIFESDLGYELQRHERSPVWLGRVTATVAPGSRARRFPVRASGRWQRRGPAAGATSEA